MLLFLDMLSSEEDKDKFEMLYDIYQKKMFYTAYDILNDYQLAEDAVQQAFMRIMRDIDKVREIKCNETRAFVVIITRNIAIDIYRKMKKVYSQEHDIDDFEYLQAVDPPMDDLLVTQENAQQVQKVLQKMRPADADILALKFFYDMSNMSIAEQLGITPNHVGVKISRAKNKLIKLLRQEVKENEEEN